MENNERQTLLARIKWQQLLILVLVLINVVQQSWFTLGSTNKWQNVVCMMIVATLVGFILRIIIRNKNVQDVEVIE